MRTYRSPLPFGAVLALLGVGTVLAVGAAVVLQAIALVPVVLGLALGVGLVYLVLTGGAAERTPPDAPAADPEPFEDPVEEADRWSRSVPSESTGPSPEPPSGEGSGHGTSDAPVDGPDDTAGAPRTGSLRNDPK